MVAVYKYIGSPYIDDYMNEIIPLFPIIEGVSFFVAIVLLLVQVNRQLSKEFLQKPYFQGEIRMPTTDFLLHINNEFSNEYKNQIRSKISGYFGMTMLTKTEESVDEVKARFLIKEAVSQIRAVLRDNELLLKHNIEYGGVRNFLGGCIQAIFFSVVLLIKSVFFPYSQNLIIVSMLFLVVYVGFLISGKKIIILYSNDYAKVLYQQFMNHTKQP
ncbi:hypothetical protein [Fibrella forsythiae]|uniref:hypothetical protein n=1 Tax=Fibrella forsythiae TaxID=2817061 RepID=UPI001E3A5743|nr:hypothetical protein [Fibrella forsythiae]